MTARIAMVKHQRASRMINVLDTLEITNIVLLMLLLIFVLLLLWQQRKGWQLIWKLNGWRGIFQQPLLWLLLLLNLDPKSVLQTATNLRKYFQRPLAILIGTRLLLYVDDPATMEQILNSHDCLDKTFLQNGFFAKDGLLHARAQKWKIRRKQLNPAFSHSIVLSFFDIFNSVGNQLQQQFSEQLQGNAVRFKDVEDMLSRAVLDVSCTTIMGTATNLTQKDENDIAKTYKKLMETSAMKIIKPWLQCDILFRLLDRNNYESSEQSNKLVQQFVNKIVLSKYQQWQDEQNQKQQSHNHYAGHSQSHSHNSEAYYNNAPVFEWEQTMDALGDMPSEPNRKRIFIEQLFHLATIGELTLQDIMDEAQSMVLVSFETISNSITIALLCLAMHLDCQHKLREEINEILPNGNVADVGVLDLQQLKYLDMIVNESLRLLTTVPMNLRNVSRDFQLKNFVSRSSNSNSNNDSSTNNYVVVPQNTIVVLDAFNMQRDELFWGADAKKFEPAHFAATTSTTAESLNQRHPYAFIPFSKGLRTCIGGRYSFFLLKIFLIKLIATFEFSTTATMDNLRYVEGISLKFLNAEHIQFKIKAL